MSNIIGLAPKPKGAIQRWMSEQSDEVRDEFMSIATKSRNAEVIKEYLDAHGCTGQKNAPVSLATTYNWINEHLPKGKQAQLIAIEAVEFAGIDTLPLAEKQIGKLSSILDTYNRIIQDADESGQLEAYLGDILKGLPALSAQLRTCIVDVAKLKNTTDTQMLMRAGAERFRQILLNSPSIRDNVHETWVTTTCQAAMAQLADEIRSSSMAA